jgi:hypothetical protein
MNLHKLKKPFGQPIQNRPETVGSCETNSFQVRHPRCVDRITSIGNNQLDAQYLCCVMCLLRLLHPCTCFEQ